MYLAGLSASEPHVRIMECFVKLGDLLFGVCVCVCAVAHVWSSESSMEVALLSYHVDPVRSQTRQMTDVYHIKADLAAKFSQHPSVLPVTGLWLACPTP